MENRNRESKRLRNANILMEKLNRHNKKQACWIKSDQETETAPGYKNNKTMHIFFGDQNIVRWCLYVNRKARWKLSKRWQSG